MRIAVASRGTAPSGAPEPAGPWPDGLSAEDVARCLAVVEARDPLTLPADRAVVAAAPLVAAALDEAAGLVGLAWRHVTPEGAEVDVRVQPGHRRRGVGRALLQAVSEDVGDAGPLWAGCDAAHARVRRFLTRQGFSLAGVVFHQRWDGAPSDAPPAFASARLESADAAMALGLLRDATAQVWPRPKITLAEAATGVVRVAVVDAAPVGVLLAHRAHDAYEVDGLAVLEAHRARGVGRALAADLMRRAAVEGLGVTLRVAQDNETALAWSQKLGFWTYRTWAMFRR